ncbi:MAG: 2-oxoacid:acceptor oxidoreductase subunit alpha [Dehalococcoidia bacterium]|jgi:2-oxoglutarate ferredoxin oxidoreductase subunit alpha|nr:2-oxoacid:acceptor oxidoreductase subunit alpha [Dehalococcoidia bacterium]
MTTETVDTAADVGAPGREPEVLQLSQHTVEIVSDSGEGAQKCGQIFGTVSAKMGNGVWTVEIIPAEIEPPPRTIDGASGNRIRIGSGPVTNWGDRTNVVVAFNEQALLGRHRLDALADDAVILIESTWATHRDGAIREQWAEAMAELATTNYRIIEVPMEEQCLTLVDDARLGKNMFVLGLLTWLYGRDKTLIYEQIASAFKGKPQIVYDSNIGLLELGLKWADEHLDFRVDVPRSPTDETMVVMNGNQAAALGAVAAGMEMAAMYPITPATAVSHYLGEMFERFGGVVHQAEDEIAAAGVAIGASYSGKVAFTITSGPGLSLKTEFLGLAVMTETPLVVLDVQRGGPSTGLPTKVEQSDLLSATFGQTGDAPHVVMAPATIEECFHVMVTARQIAEQFRTLVVVLSDANLATGVQPFPRPEPETAWLAPPPDLSPVPADTRPYEWDDETGLSRRLVPGQAEGMFTLTGLTHDELSHVAYDPQSHQRGSAMRSRKMAVLQQSLKTPPVNGDLSGDLLIVGWGSTKGAIEEAVELAREEGHSVSSLHLTFISPLPSGLKEIFERFKRVMTVEINYSDDPGDPFITDENRRRGQLSWLLRATTLVDVDCWTRVLGEPLRPGMIHGALLEQLVDRSEQASEETEGDDR